MGAQCSLQLEDKLGDCSLQLELGTSAMCAPTSAQNVGLDGGCDQKSAPPCCRLFVCKSSIPKVMGLMRPLEPKAIYVAPSQST